jgi:probable F420-dependent oxidoreductase
VTAVKLIPDGTLVYGMQLPIQSQSRLYTAEWEMRSGPRELEQIARKADETGFFYLAVCDHVAIPRELAPAMGTVWYDTVATLSYVAGITSRVRLLSHVYVLPYRHPLATAKSFATLDALSGGRAILGVGAGHVRDEFAGLGVDFAARGELLDEAIGVVSAALEDEFPEAGGPAWPVHDLGVAPRPLQRPRPPIWVGGSSKPAIRRAARLGDGWLPQGTPRKDMPAQIAYLLEHRRVARAGDPVELGAICEPLHVGKPTRQTRPGTICGSGEAIASSIRELADMGVSHVQVRFDVMDLEEQLDQMEAFATEVAPHLDA